MSFHTVHALLNREVTGFGKCLGAAMKFVEK